MPDTPNRRRKMRRRASNSTRKDTPHQMAGVDRPAVTSQAEGRGFESRLPLQTASRMKRPSRRRSRRGAGVVHHRLSQQADGPAARRDHQTPRGHGPPERAYHPYHPRDRYQRYRMVRGAIGSGPGR